MKIDFDGSQGLLKKIVALVESGRALEVSCPNCSEAIEIFNSESGSNEYPYLVCRTCNKEWRIEPGPKSRRERIWEKFDSLNGSEDQ